MKTPLAWLQLSHERIRLLVAMAGISFANLLMFMQFGFRDALFESAVVLHRRVKGDVFLMSPESTALIAMSSFSQRRLYQSLGVEGVEAIYPIYLDFALWKNPETKATRAIMAIGINPVDDVLDFPGLTEHQHRIKRENGILFDRLSRPEFGPVADWFAAGKLVETEAGGQRLTVLELFELGASFGADGNILVSDQTFLNIFPSRQRGVIDMGVIVLDPGLEPELVIAQLKTLLPNDVMVMSRQEFIDFEKNYWQTATAIGFIFSLGAGMGFIVGIVIVYQILYTDVADHLPEYATLKAMGYGDRYLLGVVFQQALILAVIGYAPGLGISSILYVLTAQATSLPMAMTLGKATTVLVLTVVMCVGSGAIAMRKLSAADPADIF
ncbi:ABC transporter permease DevC [Spirulina sp. CCNP1310]|uniref:ABC transporter permease DevC n=1 Tax=Spirulina sp. CCNP1310 TaxID=3110249 RepID=UPI002B2110ED|nr:ABC transporter permease DevC [Spirulina sp. CCNP1310]MEA5417656.1 ABC transporter permease DevC [Spirulina sp. CCNP1310]